MKAIHFSRLPTTTKNYNRFKKNTFGIKMSSQYRRMLGSSQNYDEEEGTFLQGIEITGQIVMPPTKALVMARKHELEIENLWKKLNGKDREIAEHERKLQEILEKNNELKIKLKTKDDEVKELQEKIQTLENEKKGLQEKLSIIEIKLKMLEDEMSSLTKKSKDHETENRKLKEHLQKIEYSFSTTKTNLTNENEKLKGDIKELKETMTGLSKESTMLPYPPIQPANDQTVALLHLGELCCQIQNSMYQKILPDHYLSWDNYKVENIEEDINDPSMVENESERVEAAKNLQELKTSLNWNKGLEVAVKSLQRSRNTKAHPPIKEASVRKHAKDLHDQGQLRGRLSLERVNQLIDIWKCLKQEK